MTARLLGSVVISLVCAAASSEAATLNVDGESCSLPDAIRAANGDVAVGGCPAGSGADQILIDRDVFLDADLEPIRGDLSIVGVGLRTISGRG